MKSFRWLRLLFCWSSDVPFVAAVVIAVVVVVVVVVDDAVVSVPAKLKRSTATLQESRTRAV